MNEKTSYPGIDYSLGQSNVDKETGIHFGVISANSLFNCGEEFFDNAEDLSYKAAVKAQKAKIKSFLSDELYVRDRLIDSMVSDVWDIVEESFNDTYENDNPDWRYSKDGLIIETCLDYDLVVLKSPYYTYAQFCSPCVPGAGNLDHPIDGGAKTYCLPFDWFAEEECPYTKIYSVETGERVTGIKQ